VITLWLQQEATQNDYVKITQVLEMLRGKFLLHALKEKKQRWEGGKGKGGESPRGTEETTRCEVVFSGSFLDRHGRGVENKMEENTTDKRV